MNRSTTTRLFSMFLALSILISCFAVISAKEADQSSFELLKGVFAQAEAEYAVSAHALSDETHSVFYHKETVLPDGTTLVVTGYPTEYSCDPELKTGEDASNYIYALTSTELDEYNIKKNKTWGYLSSTIKYYDDTTNKKVRIDSFSYKIALNSGYSMSNMQIKYFSYDASNSVSESNTINTTSLTMTNYPTTRLGWVRSDVTATEGQINTGVQYYPTINGVRYGFGHNIVPYGNVEY